VNLTYTNTLPDKEQFFALFQTTGWFSDRNLDVDRLYAAISNTWYMVSAYDNGNLVGFGRVISDGTLHAMITEVIILPQYQGKGIGSNIVNDLVEKCQKNDMIHILLISASGKAGFYEKHGFIRRSDAMPGMHFVGGKHDDT
jgi:ribosomal protein S18 acetylase RimI-like enzyme